MLNSGPIHQRTGQSFLKFLFELRALGVKSLTSYLQRFPTHIGIDTLADKPKHQQIYQIYFWGQIFNVYGQSTYQTVVFRISP